MDGREIMLAICIIDEDKEQDKLVCTLWDPTVGPEVINYCKTCHEMSCYKNGAVLILNKDKDNEIKIITDVYEDKRGSMWVKARNICQDFEIGHTRRCCGMYEVTTYNKQRRARTEESIEDIHYRALNEAYGYYGQD